MNTSANLLPCDGCGLPATAEHIAARLRRLELATRFRPVHIGVLFVALAPPAAPEGDFYGPPDSKAFFDPFLDALEIVAPGEAAGSREAVRPEDLRLAEFQHRGHFLAYLSECPIDPSREAVGATMARLSPTLIRRIRFNYRPKCVAPVGQELLPLVGILEKAGIGPVVTPGQGQVLPAPGTGAGQWAGLFERAMANAASR